jgi:hypothetical protein
VTVAESAGMSWPEISLLFFLTLFIAMVLRLVFSRSARWRSAARIPLDEEPQQLHHDTRGTEHD